jgi:type II secretory pathway pseudopilin PulG
MLQGSSSITSKSMSPRLALRFALSFTCRLANRRHLDQGLTLIEGLVAIIVITVTLVSILPPIFWATGTRVQNRKAEQASQLAQGEVDRVRTLMERGGYTLTQLPPIPPGATNANIRQATIAAAPTNSTGTLVSSNSSCNTGTGIPPTDYQRYTPVDTDNLPGPCSPEFLIQTFRSPGVDENGAELTLASTTLPHGFVMGVRVYANVAATELAAGRGQTQQASLKGTSGLGGQRFRPLAAQYTTIVRSSASQNLSVYRTLCPATSRGSGQC